MFFTEAVLATNYETLFAAWYVWIEREKRERVRERERERTVYEVLFCNVK